MGNASDSTTPAWHRLLRGLESVLRHMLAIPFSLYVIHWLDIHVEDAMFLSLVTLLPLYAVVGVVAERVQRTEDAEGE